MSTIQTNERLAGRGMASSLIGLAVWLLLSFAVATFGAQFEPGDWYRQLAKPPWTPPNWLFGPVWTLLYIGMAAAAWLVWREGGVARQRAAIGFYMLQLILNALWSWLFFGLHLVGSALVDIVFLWAAIVVTMVLFYRRRRLAGILMIPYLLWVSFATVLNLQIWRLN